MTRLVLETGFVARVSLVKPAHQVRGRGPAQVLDKVPLDIVNRAEPDARAKTLDRADAREGLDHRLAHAVANQKLGLRDIGIVGRRRVDRLIEQRRGEFARVALLPCANRRNTVAGARRNIVTALIEPPVTSHAANDQRFPVSMAREQVRRIKVEFAEAQGVPPGCRFTVNWTYLTHVSLRAEILASPRVVQCLSHLDLGLGAVTSVNARIASIAVGTPLYCET